LKDKALMLQVDYDEIRNRASIGVDEYYQKFLEGNAPILLNLQSNVSKSKPAESPKENEN
jgi:hypothetical protein